jgi:hypothetical protein
MVRDCQKWRKTVLEAKSFIIEAFILQFLFCLNWKPLVISKAVHDSPKITYFDYIFLEGMEESLCCLMLRRKTA